MSSNKKVITMPKKKVKVAKAAQKVAKAAKKVEKEVKEVKKVTAKMALKAKEPPSNFKNTAKKLVHTGVEWLFERGWETIVSLTAGALLISDPGVRALAKVDPWTNLASTITAGTILYRFPISATMFGDTNDRLQKQLSLYTKYKFEDSEIHFKGASGELVSGQIGIFVIPDPNLVVTSTDPQSINRLVRQYNGTVVKVSKTAVVKIPNVRDPLFTSPDPNSETRFENQGTVYIVAMTDLDSTVAIGEFAIKFTIAMNEPANTGVLNKFEPPFGCSMVSWQGQNAFVYNTTQTNIAQVANIYPMFGRNGITRTGDALILYPGSYRFSTNARFNYNGSAPLSISFVWNHTLVDAKTSALITSQVTQNFYSYTSASSLIYSANMHFVANVDRLAALQINCNNTSSANGTITISQFTTFVDSLVFYPVDKIASSALTATSLNFAQEPMVASSWGPSEIDEQSEDKEASNNTPVGPSQSPISKLSDFVSQCVGFTVVFTTFARADRFIDLYEGHEKYGEMVERSQQLSKLENIAAAAKVDAEQREYVERIVQRRKSLGIIAP